MKTMNDFKGTQGDWNLRGNKIFIGDTYKSVATIHMVHNWDILRGQPVQDIEAQANEKLLANSKKVLELLIEAEGFVDSHFFPELKARIEQAINDSL